MKRILTVITAAIILFAVFGNSPPDKTSSGDLSKIDINEKFQVVDRNIVDVFDETESSPDIHLEEEVASELNSNYGMIRVHFINVGQADIYRTDEQGTVVVTADQNKKVTVDKKSSTIKENAPPVVVQTPIENVENGQPLVSDNQSQVVYRTRTGKKYHRAGCSYLKSKIETTVNEAKSMGLGPCSRCNPPR